MMTKLPKVGLLSFLVFSLLFSPGAVYAQGEGSVAEMVNKL